MSEAKHCGGCGEMKPEAEFKTSAMGDYVCAECQKYDAISAEFSELENEEARLTDEIMELKSSLESAKELVARRQAALDEALQRAREHGVKMTQFKWEREAGE
ncbi:hypothetical protein [Paenibacillus campinasensis]|uniref:Uncharacterized protein n=1 Tax=Paenibacillus campinasensis TaxID=66347 RepID=A0A268EGZ8_9BACL|nr:hypothetical protein [Paenibacillus campinasensis]PAD72396.1 hypothetical protein CHH67_22405 [Paenibacillus campinasensis]